MPLRSKQTGQGLPIIRPASPSADCQKNSAVTRSGRSVRPPSYLKDYVQTFWNDFLYLFTLVTVQFFFQRRKGVTLLLSRNPLSRDSTQRIICVKFHVLVD